MTRKPSFHLLEGIVKATKDSRLGKAKTSGSKAEPQAVEISDLKDELRSLTVKQLRERAKEWSINLHGRKKKEEIVEVLAAALAETEAPPQEESNEEQGTPESSDIDLPFGNLEDLWIEATKNLSKGDYKSAIALSKDALRILDEWSSRYKRGICSKAIEAAHRFARRFIDDGRSKELEAKVNEAEKAFDKGDFDGCSRRIEELQEVVADLYVEQVARVRELMAEKERSLEELGTINADTSKANQLLSQAEEAIRLDDQARALEFIHRFDQVVEEARKSRREELKGYMGSVEAKLAETESLGASLRECRKLIRQARTAFERGDLVLANEIARRCERTAIEAQKEHIEMALELRKKHYQEVTDLIAYLKPLLEEAQDYGVDIERAKALIREAIELLRHEQYFEAMERAEGAQAFLKTLHPSIAVERERRGIVKPEEGICSHCNSEDLEFGDSGWGECRSCGHRFLWSMKEQPRILTFLKRKLVG